MKSTKTDYELITGFINGDERSIEHLILRHKSKVYSYINLYIRSRDLADDIFQDTFLKVVQMIGVIVTLLAMRSRAYRALSVKYEEQAQELAEVSPA